MSNDSSTSTPLKLSVYTVVEWKNNLITRALELNALGILENTENAPASTEARLTADYNARKSKIAGYIRSTLDTTQISTILTGIHILDIPAVYKALLDAYEPKTSASRVSILQELVSLRQQDNETFEQYGSRAMEIANRLISLLPAGPTYVPETVTAVTAYNSLGGTTPSYTLATFNQILAGGRSSYVQGYTANDLARHLALSMIPIGLGDSESAKML